MTFQPSQYQNLPLRAFQNQDRTIYYSHAAQELEQSLTPHFPGQDPRPNLVSLIDKQTQQGGTGLLLNKYGFVLTSYHLVNQFKKNHSSKYHYHIQDSSHRAHSIDPSFFAYDQTHDIAIIRALGTPQSTSSIAISNNHLQLSQLICYIAYVDGINISRHLGQIKSTSYDVHYEHKTILDAIAFSGEGQRGFSGAPLFNHQNHLVGNLFGGGYLDDEYNNENECNHNNNENDEDENNDEELNFGTKAIYITKLIQELITNLHNTK